MAEISGLLKEVDTVMGLAKEKVEKTVEIAASVAGSNENSENASKEDWLVDA